MHRYKLIPPILLILSFISFLLATPVEIRQERVDVADADALEDVIFIQESGKRSEELEKQWDEPSQKQTTSTGLIPAPSVGEPPANQELANNSPPPQTGTSSIQNTASSVSSPDKQPSDENYHASNGGGPGPGSTVSHPPASTRPLAEPLPFHWNLPDDWSEMSSEAWPKETFMSKAESFLADMIEKIPPWAGSGCLKCLRE